MDNFFEKDLSGQKPYNKFYGQSIITQIKRKITMTGNTANETLNDLFIWIRVVCHAYLLTSGLFKVPE